jgi:peptidoglycan-associated lipoprotein
MTGFTVKAIVLLAVVGLSACTDPGRFGAGGRDGGGVGGTAQAGFDGAAADPASPAYFQAAIGDRVLFEVDQSTLTFAAQNTLAQQAGWLQTNTAYTAPASTTLRLGCGVRMQCRNISSARALQATACGP